MERAKYQKLGGPDAEGFDAGATFITRRPNQGDAIRLYLIYPEGNHITASEQHYLQIGETKYGKPILDRIIRHETSPETALRCAPILSVDSTMRSNATVGPPLECLFYRNDSLEPYELYSTLEGSHPLPDRDPAGLG